MLGSGTMLRVCLFEYLNYELIGVGIITCHASKFIDVGIVTCHAGI